MNLNGVGCGAQGTAVNQAPSADGSVQREKLARVSEKLSDIRSGRRDTLEISEVARKLSQAARASQRTEPIVEKSQYSPGAKAPSGLDTREGRTETANDYNAVLESYRSKYGEKEAMRKFDEFMKEQGFERVDANYSGWSANAIGDSAKLSRSVFYGSVYTNGLDSLFNDNRDHLDSNLQTRSGIYATMIDGKTEYSAETYATYAVEYSKDVYDTVESVFNRNLDAIKKETDFDVEGLLRKFDQNGQLSAASVSTDLANITNDVLKKAGIELQEGQTLAFTIHPAENGKPASLNVLGNFDTTAIQKAIDTAVTMDSGILDKFTSELTSVKALDVTSLNGQMADGDRSIEFYDRGRTFILSGDDPSAMVMADDLGIRSKGYTYQKKVSDSFDPNADFKVIMVPGGGATSDQMTSDLEKTLRDAVANGNAIDSTITRKEYEQSRAKDGGILKEFGLQLGADENAVPFTVMTEEEQQALLHAEKSTEAAKNARTQKTSAEVAKAAYFETKKELSKTTLQDFMFRF